MITVDPDTHEYRENGVLLRDPSVTAILKADGELVLATVGMPVGGRFQVVAIAADRVELEDLVDHSCRTYRLK